MKTASSNKNQSLKPKKCNNPEKTKDDNIQANNEKPKIKRMENWYYIATYVLALVALISLGLSIWTSSKSSKTNNELFKSITSFTEPIIKFNKIIFGPPPPNINCENPPLLINIEYRNASYIPIKLQVKSANTYFGEFPIHKSQKSEPPIEFVVLAPGEPWGLTQGISKEVRDIMKNKINQFQPPFLILDFEFIISTLNDQRKYNVHLQHRIGLDCNNYSSQYNLTTITESYIPIIAKE